MTRPLILLPAFFVLFVSCEKPSSRDNHLDRLAESYSSLLMLYEETKSQQSTIPLDHYQQRVDSILAQNGFTRPSFLSSLQQLSGEPAAFQSFSQKLTEFVALNRQNP